MTVLTALGVAFRFRDIALANSVEQEPGNDLASAEATLIPLIALFVINSVILLGCGKYLERAWGSREFFRFLAVTSIGAMLAVYLTCLFEYLVRSNEDVLYETQAYGLTAVIAGFLVGFKQLVPEHLITLWGIISVRVKTLPMLFALSMFINSLITRSQIQLMMAVYGLFISWIYSRFFKVQDGIRGDRSETFSFASFFPEAAQPPVKALSNIVFGILVRLRVCSPLGFGATLEHDLDNHQISGMVLPMTQPASLRAEAERRRYPTLVSRFMKILVELPRSITMTDINTQSLNTESNILFETTVLDEDPTSASAKPMDEGNTDSTDSSSIVTQS
ncbi:hypothetical protein BGZ65_005278 [Modicella reniformis]|uniref:Transmembrane protein 115 n=1 Tax=Modicella reniformis TaxID=1440133 RepID=A0A9P6MLJ6_9FUNG|nr:hypothetical protein BGZ65_005278 [Modicella reniformis]